MQFRGPSNTIILANTQNHQTSYHTTTLSLPYKQAASKPAKPTKPKTYLLISVALLPFVTGLTVVDAFGAFDDEATDEAFEEVAELLAGLDVVVTTTAVVEPDTLLVEVETMVPLDGLLVEVETMVLLFGLEDVAGIRDVDVDVVAT